LRHGATSRKVEGSIYGEPHSVSHPTTTILALQDFIDFLKRTRWKLYQVTNRHTKVANFPSAVEAIDAEMRLSMWQQPSKGRFTHSMPRPCRSHAVPLPCRALIHTCHTALQPCSDSAVSFVKVRMVAGHIRTATPAV
jgi:hypothetical protein